MEGVPVRDRDGGRTDGGRASKLRCAIFAQTAMVPLQPTVPSARLPGRQDALIRAVGKAMVSRVLCRVDLPCGGGRGRYAEEVEPCPDLSSWMNELSPMFTRPRGSRRIDASYY